MSVVESVRRIIGTGVSIDWETIDPIPLTQSELHDLLSVDRRRLLLEALVLDGDGKMTLSDLAEYIARVENGIGPDEELGAAQRKRVYVSLYQLHLRRLEEAGLIDYGERRNLVTARSPAREMVKLSHGISRTTSGVPL